MARPMVRERPRRRRTGLAAAILLLALAAGVVAWIALKPLERRFVDADQETVGRENTLSLGPGSTAGQTFVARHAGLAGIELWLGPGAPPGDEAQAESGPSSAEAARPTLTLHLRAEPDAAEDLAVAAAAVPRAAQPGYVRFEFAPRADSLGQYYYAWIEVSLPAGLPTLLPAGLPTGRLSLPLADGTSYPDGAAYRDGEPLDAQTSFRLVYAPLPVLGSLLLAVPRALGLVGAAVLLLILPGWALLAWLGPARPIGFGEKAGLAAGIGLALLPLLVLWTDLVGLHLGAWYAWLPAGAGLAFVVRRAPGVARRLRAALVASRSPDPPVAGRSPDRPAWPDLASIVVLALIVGTRLLAVRTVEVPLWGDGYQHTLIAQLLVDHGGLFDSWLPYSAIDRFTYHFGFHSAAAAFHWLTGLPAAQSVLWAGQVLNALAILALYPLAVRVSSIGPCARSSSQSRWGGAACLLVAGLLSPMPSEYVNWGRYTQLAGQVILPAAAWLTWELVEATGRRWRLAALVAATAGGLALTHYRVLAFYAVFVVALLPFYVRREGWRRAVPPLAAGMAGAALLFLPWLLHTFEGEAIRLLGHQLTTLPAQVSAVTRESSAVGSLRRYLAPGLWLLFPVGLAWATLRRRRGPLAILLWSALMVLAANPAWLGLPGSGSISTFAIAIAVYIPAGLLAAFLLAQAAHCLPPRKLLQAALALLVVGAGVWGALDRLRDIDVAGHAYVARPDVRAAGWIRERTSPAARFLVNSAPAFGGTAVVGTDGGWWLPLLAERQATVPPLSYATELSGSSELRQQMEEVARLADEGDAADPGVVAALRRAGVTHVYIGQRQGALEGGSSPALDPERLLGSAAYRPVYHQDRVWVFELMPAGGE